MEVCLPQVIKSFKNYRGVATTYYPNLVHEYNPLTAEDALHVMMQLQGKSKAPGNEQRDEPTTCSSWYGLNA
jgi:hypothetical protein